MKIPLSAMLPGAAFVCGGHGSPVWMRSLVAGGPGAVMAYTVAGGVRRAFPATDVVTLVPPGTVKLLALAGEATPA